MGHGGAFDFAAPDTCHNLLDLVDEAVLGLFVLVMGADFLLGRIQDGLFRKVGAGNNDFSAIAVNHQTLVQGTYNAGS
ncbi:hypothetical protein D3C75_1251630 [compost metagenome]